VAVYSSSNCYIRLYINGQLVNQHDIATNTSMINSSEPLYIGQDVASYVNGGYFTGSFDELRIYSKILSLGEIDSLYSSEN